MPTETFAGKLLGQTIHENFERDAKTSTEMIHEGMRDIQDFLTYKVYGMHKSFMSYCRCMCIPGTRGKSN